ncbi:hypothetical protein L2E82_09096 [Cichorium intybus]|uniref:Uncharacterized protein n=1 Tax=Cichorium intybus TaxID=13427 RepID=A0ACB9G8I2_CICIN|nr:hypothetical protein L2E82_09096 [Cichorium intybus]
MASSHENIIDNDSATQEDTDPSLRDSDSSLDLDEEVFSAPSMVETVNDQFLNILCDRDSMWTTFDAKNDANHNSDDDFVTNEKTPDSEQLKQGIQYRVHNSETEWNLMRPYLREKYENPAQLKSALISLMFTSISPSRLDFFDAATHKGWAGNNPTRDQGSLKGEIVALKNENVKIGESIVVRNNTRSIRPLVKVSVIKNSKTVKVLLDWTDKEHDLFDANYFKDLPMVHKPGVTVKKTKQESISLFSCLDAFLKEEPLRPADMWYCPGCAKNIDKPQRNLIYRDYPIL